NNALEVCHTCTLYCVDCGAYELSTLSLHDALPIFAHPSSPGHEIQLWKASAAEPGNGSANDSASRTVQLLQMLVRDAPTHPERLDRKSTRLNSSHVKISYAVFCLKTKKNSSVITLT